MVSEYEDEGRNGAGFCGLVHLKIGMFKGETWVPSYAIDRTWATRRV